MEMDDKSLLVSADDRIPVRVSRQAITRLEVSTGRHRRALKGMFIGAGIGAALIGPAYHSDAKSSNCDNALFPCTTSLAGAEAFGILVGATYGAGIGALIESDWWSAVPLEHVRVSLAPTRGRGVVLSLSVGF